MDYVSLGLRIRNQRKRLDLTQEELAHKVGVTVSYIGHIERSLKHCSLDLLVDIANVLETTPDVLLQDSLLNGNLCVDDSLSPSSRSILNDIVNVLREHDTP